MNRATEATAHEPVSLQMSLRLWLRCRGMHANRPANSLSPSAPEAPRVDAQRGPVPAGIAGYLLPLR